LSYKLTNIVLKIAASVVSLDCGHLGNALKSNPGYLKLRRIRAAQSVSNTVRLIIKIMIMIMIMMMMMMMMMMMIMILITMTMMIMIIDLSVVLIQVCWITFTVCLQLLLDRLSCLTQ